MNIPEGDEVESMRRKALKQVQKNRAEEKAKLKKKVKEKKPVNKKALPKD